jgi:prophage antirepressor-like protein
MSELTIFDNSEFGEVRTLTRNGEPWFVAADVCRVLELGNPSQAITRLEDDEKANTLISNEGVRGNPNMTIINEPGLYTLVLGSRKPEAKTFKRWITHEVIPAIRKTGVYSAPGAERADEIANLYARTVFSRAESTRLLRLGRCLEEENRRLEAQIKALDEMPEPQRADALMVLLTAERPTDRVEPAATEPAKATERNRTRVWRLVDDLPPNVRRELDAMLDDVHNGYVEISEWLKERGYSISKSSIGRYAKAREE